MSSSIAPNAVEIRIFWGGELHDVVELSPPRAFHVGDGATSTEPVDFTLPESDTSSGRTPLVRVEGGEVRVTVPFGARASVRGSAEPVPSDVVLQPGKVVDVQVGTTAFSIRLGGREARCPRGLLADRDSRPLAYFGASLLGVGSIAASLAFTTPPLGLTGDEALDKDRLYLMMAYLDAAAEREQEPPPESGESASGAPDAHADPAAGEAGKMGRRDETRTDRRASGSQAGAEIRPALSREEAIAEAATFGLAGMLASSAMKATPAPWDDLGVGPVAAMGALFGSELGDSGGLGGLGLHGIGEGGGHRGNQIGLGAIGTCTGTTCDGSGFGVGGQRRGPGHVAKVPTIRTVTTDVSGSLPPEVIQRVVRQSFGRFRHCYEDGLRTNPNLEGRVTARFVIGRDGAVATVQSGGSDLPDAGVVSCVLRAYSALSFPAPKDGVVRVVYPLMFTPSA